ncbi:hypothetical protein JW859_10710 [bacterium]|nr:hypothetical protein [bacterium]
MPENPIAHYYRIAHKRRRPRGPGTLIGKVAIIATVTLVIAYLVFSALFGASLRGFQNGIIEYAGIAIVVVAAIGFYVYLFRELTAVSGTAMSALSRHSPAHNELGITTELAASSITDREVVVGVLAVLAPRLFRLCLIGTLLYAAVTFYFQLQTLPFHVSSLNSFSYFVILRSLILPLPLALLNIIAGVLGSLILLLWLFVYGRGTTGRVRYGLVGALLGLGHVLQLFISAAAFAAHISSGWNYRTAGGAELLSYACTLAAIAVLMVLAYGLVLAGTLSQRRASASGPVIFALFYPVSIALLVLGIIESNGDYLFSWAYVSAWDAVMIFNPVGPTALQLMLTESLDVEIVIANGLIRYLVLLGQQLVMIAIGLEMARRAVALYRQPRFEPTGKH